MKCVLTIYQFIVAVGDMTMSVTVLGNHCKSGLDPNPHLNDVRQRVPNHNSYPWVCPCFEGTLSLLGLVLKENQQEHHHIHIMYIFFRGGRLKEDEPHFHICFQAQVETMSDGGCLEDAFSDFCWWLEILWLQELESKIAPWYMERNPNCLISSHTHL